jgi:hypothetical protein
VVDGGLAPFERGGAVVVVADVGVDRGAQARAWRCKRLNQISTMLSHEA